MMTASTPDEFRLNRVLVTGGRGFIGAHLVNCLASHGWGVISADIAPIHESNNGAVELKVDVRDSRAIQELFSKFQFGAVFDLASITDIGLPPSSYKRNIEATETIANVVEKFRVPRYVFFSSQFVFRKQGISPPGPYEYAPSEAYGESKVISEQIIVDRISPERRLILRPTYIWGPGLERFRTGLLSRLESGQMLVSDDPQAKRYYGYVGTVVEQAYRLLNAWAISSLEQVLYLSDDAISLQQFCQHLIDALGYGRFWSVHPIIIRALGELGTIIKLIGLRPPIDRIQARELTGQFPVPIARTLALTECRTDYTLAAQETVKWARTQAYLRQTTRTVV